LRTYGLTEQKCEKESKESRFSANTESWEKKLRIKPLKMAENLAKAEMLK